MTERTCLSSTQLIGLIAVNLAPAVRNTDGRWRSAWKAFPAEGVSEEDLCTLRDEGLIEMTPTVALVTDFGRRVLQADGGPGPYTAMPARPGTQDAHLSLQ